MPRRERFKNGVRRDQDAKYAAQVRACCDTNRESPHQPTCVRQIGRCADKVAFQSREAASKQAAKYRTETSRMVPYRCASCGLHHIGHPRDESEGL